MSDHHATKEQAALASIFASAFITVAKLVAGLFSGSLALISEAGHAAVDTGATIMTYFAVRVSAKPADDKHHYGHGKVESLVALIETGLLFALAAYVLVEAIRRLFIAPVEVDAGWLVFGVLIVSIVIDAVRWYSLSKIAKETKSDALAADALHFSSDLFASVMVLLGLLASHFGFKQGDTVAAFGVAIFVAIAGYQLARRTLDTLLDAAPEGMTDHIRGIAENVPGVLGVDELRLRPSGSTIMGEMTVAVARTLPQERVAAIRAEVIAAIVKDQPDSSIVVTTELRTLDDETVLESVLLAAARRRLPVHHITVQHIGGKISVSFDVELDGNLPLSQAHDIASAMEESVREEIGPDVEVESHIEPLEVRELAGQDADPVILESITRALHARAKEIGDIKEIHYIRARDTAAGLVVNYHCRVDSRLSVNDVHDQVDALDRNVRSDFPKITRIVGHAEPLKAPVTSV